MNDRLLDAVAMFDNLPTIGKATKPRLDTHKLPHYFVRGCLNTGVWLDEPIFIGHVMAESFYKKKDTSRTHYDTYEHFPTDDMGRESVSSETRAVTVRWVK